MMLLLDDIPTGIMFLQILQLNYKRIKYGNNYYCTILNKPVSSARCWKTLGKGNTSWLLVQFLHTDQPNIQ